MGLTDKLAGLLGAKPDEAVEGPSGGPHPAPPEDTVDDPDLETPDR